MKPWHMFLRLLTFRPGLALVTLLSWILISLVPLGLAVASKRFFDELSSGAPATAGLWWLVVLPLAIQGMRLLVTWLSVPVTTMQRFVTAALLSTNLMAHLLKRPGASAFAGSPGDVINRFRDDVGDVSSYLSIFRLLGAVGEGLTSLLALAVMLWINPKVTMLAVLPLVAVVALVQAMGRRIDSHRKQSRAATARVTGALGEIFGMVQALKLAGAEARVTEHLRRLSDDRRRSAVAESLFSEAMRSVFTNFGAVGTGLVLLLAADALQSGRFTVGDFALFAALVGRVTLFTGTLGDAIAGYKQAAVSLRRMHGLMAEAEETELVTHRPIHLDGPLPEVTLPERQTEPLQVLEAVGLTYLYPATGRGVEGVDLLLRRGTLTVITGRVGSGKTTLLRALLGLLTPQSGEVRWNGHIITDPANHFQPPHCSYTAQVPVLVSASVRENILMGLPDDAVSLNAALTAAVMEEDLAGFEQGLDTQVGARGLKLSGGQAQRTAAARMFIRNTDLAVFDDLSSALDVSTEAKLIERLRCREGQTCLAVSTRRGALAAADQILVLKDGKVEATGTAAELLKNSPEFVAIYTGGEEAQAS